MSTRPLASAPRTPAIKDGQLAPSIFHSEPPSSAAVRYLVSVSGVMRLVLLNFSHSVVVSVKQLVDRCRTRPHLRSGRRTADALDHPAADEPPLPGRRPVPGQHVTHGRMAPPPGSRSRYRIDCCAYATPDPGHPALRLRTDPPAPMMRPVPAKQQFNLTEPATEARKVRRVNPDNQPPGLPG
jgi:hypothetical protein